MDKLIYQINIFKLGRGLVSGFGCSEKIERTDSFSKPMIKFGENSNGRLIANGDTNYFSPERQRANEGDYRFDAELSDSYSVGLALWELVTGEKVEEYRVYGRSISSFTGSPNLTRFVI